MKALYLAADWVPKATYPLSKAEERSRKVRSGASVWRYPTLEPRNVTDPEPAPDEVVIEVAAVGICGSDMHMVETADDGYMLYPGLTRLPNILGHEFSGRVVEVGSTITDLPVGTLVTAEEIQWCGRCDSCRRGLVNHCTDLEELGFTTPGAMAQYVAVRARYCWSLTELAARLGDDRTALTLGALVEPCGVSYHAMFNRLAAPRPGAAVAVFGAGPIGLTATALAATAGAATVIALDISPSRLERAREMGATEVLNPTGLDLNEVLLEATCGRGVDLVVEAAGAPEHTLSPLTDGLAVGATIVHIGRSEHPTALPLEHYQTRGVQLAGSLGHAGHATFPNIIRLLASGRLDLRPMLSARYPLDRAAEAFRRLESRRDAKILLEPNP